MRVAIIHDDLNQYGGAEKVLKTFHEIWPEAPIFTSVYDKPAMQKRGWSDKGMDIRTSFLDKTLPSKKLSQPLFFLHPFFYENFDFSEFDVVISLSARFAHGVVTSPNTIHIAYLNSIAPFLWDYNTYVKLRNFSFWQKTLLPLFTTPMRIWDQAAMKRPDLIIANSKFTARRVEKIFKRKCDAVIYPQAADLKPFLETRAKKGIYFLWVSRLVPNKRPDIVIEAFNRLGLALKVAGDGPKRFVDSLKKKAKSNIEFLDFVQPKKLPSLYANCKALVYGGIEDFGIVFVEANASGKPVIAFDQGGVREIIKHDTTGILVKEKTVRGLIKAIEDFDEKKFKVSECRKNARGFEREEFKRKMKGFVGEAVEEK